MTAAFSAATSAADAADADLTAAIAALDLELTENLDASGGEVISRTRWHGDFNAWSHQQAANVYGDVPGFLCSIPPTDGEVRIEADVGVIRPDRVNNVAALIADIANVPLGWDWSTFTALGGRTLHPHANLPPSDSWRYAKIRLTALGATAPNTLIWLESIQGPAEIRAVLA